MRKKYYNDDTNTKELITYHMCKSVAEGLLNNRKDSEKKIEPIKYLCDYVNREFGIKGICIDVTYD